MYPPNTFPEGEAHFLMKGPSGFLEVLTTFSVGSDRVAIICHPHPLYQGTMYNKVVSTLARTFHQLGCHTIRFNFRGVGKSEGTFGESIGESEDLCAVLEWANKVLAIPQLILAGFSFGAYIAATGAAKYPCLQLYSIAPAVTNQPFENLLSIGCPWVVIQGENDEIIESQKVIAWFENHQHKANMTLITMPNTSHFFHGKLNDLRVIVEKTFLKSL